MWALVQSVLSGALAVAARATWSDWGLLAVALMGALYLYGTWTYDYFEKRNVHSHRPKYPFVGSNPVLLSGKVSLHNLVKNTYEVGKDHAVYGFFEFRKPIFMIRDPELIKIVAVKEFDHFPNHKQFINEKSDPIFGKNLIFIKDQRWRDMRATLSPAFTTSKMKGMFPLMSECGEQMAQYLKKRYEESHEGAQSKPISTDMKDLFTRVANDVIATTAFGVSCDSLSQPKNDFYSKGMKLTEFTGWQQFAFVGYILFPKLMEKLKISLLNSEATSFFYDLVMETVSVRQKKSIFRPDMLQLLMQARAGQLKEEADDEREDIQTNKKHKLTDQDIVAQAVIFFFAGFETVSTALCFTTVALSHEPDVQRRLQEEVDDVMKRTGGKLSYEAVQGMKYLDMVVNESLRRYGPQAAVDRECTKATTLPATHNEGPVHIRKGDLVWIPVCAIHHDPEHWPDPYKFDPERFSDENKHHIKPFTFMPFGVGPRICIAQRFAMQEVKIGLAHLLAHFHLKPCDKTKYPIEYEPGLKVNAKGGLWCDLVPRNKPSAATSAS